jgi:tetratricopeptide (TPR) repeat protein
MRRAGPCRTVHGALAVARPSEVLDLRRLFPGLLAVLAVLGMLLPLEVGAAPRRKRKAELGELVERMREAETSIVKAERAAAADAQPSEEQLAKRLVAGQLKLGDGDYEGAAITFLDLMENHFASQAGPQAVYYLGEALVHLDMHRWAAELFSRNLGDARVEAARFKQRSVARLLDLAHPRREEGFARRPGLSATPEVRARLRGLGIDVTQTPLEGVIRGEDLRRLERWAESFGRSEREPELRYSYGRHLFLEGHHDRAMDELDSLSPLDIPMTKGGPDAKFRVRAAYIAAAAALAAGQIDEALERFARIVKARPREPRERQVVELAWMAMGRIHHDLDEPDMAVKAYRRVGRNSVFFPEAMYETAWTLLAARQYEQAAHALDLLLVYDPDSPIAPEIKQLRGKVKIQQRDYQAAEEEFLSLRRDFDRLAKQLGRKLEATGDARAYFASVVAQDMEHFSLGSLLPVAALPVARSLSRVVQAEDLAQDVGKLERELHDVRDLLARMEEAVQARYKARLFNDLGAHTASLDNVDDMLVDIEETLVLRLAGRAEGAGLSQLENQRLALRDKLDRPLGPRTGARDVQVDRLRRLLEQAHKLDLTVSAMRAQLVATERYYEETRKDQKIDHQGFLAQATELRDTVAALEAASQRLRNKITRAQAAMRYEDPLLEARAVALGAYREHLARMHAALAQAVSDPDAATLWQRSRALHERAESARSGLERAAVGRLQDAIAILVEERANLDRYLVELTGAKTRTRDLVAQVLESAYGDVVAEVANMVLRSEVGLLDVAWSMKEAQTEAIHHLEVERDRDMRELNRAVDMGLEDLDP